MNRRRMGWVGLLLAGLVLAVYLAEPPTVHSPWVGTWLHRKLHGPPPAGSTYVPREAAEAAQRSARGKAWAQWYRSRKHNAFSVPQTARQDVLQAGPGLLADLETFLDDDRELVALPTPTQVLHGHPPVVLERMAVLDILELVATTEALPGDRTSGEAPLVQQAQDMLAARVTRGAAEGESAVLRGVRRAEQHDALLALMHANPKRGLELYAALNTRTARFLQSAVMLALIDLGMPEGEALRTAQEARP